MNSLARCCVAFLLSSPWFSNAENTLSMKPEDFVCRYEKALATQEWEQVEPLIHRDCTATFSNGSTHRGKERVREAFQRNFDAIRDEKYAISEVHWVVRDETFAVFTYAFHWSGTIQGEAASGAGRGTSTLQREGEVWRLVSEHLGPQS